MAAAGLVPCVVFYTLVRNVPDRAGPGDNDGSSVVWLYHSHNWEPKDVNAGLIGPMVITRRGAARPDGSPKDVDQKFPLLFMLVYEKPSHILQTHINTYIQYPTSINKLAIFPFPP